MSLWIDRFSLWSILLNDNGVTENWSQELGSLSFHSGPANSVLFAGWLIDLKLEKLEPCVSTAVMGARLSRGINMQPGGLQNLLLVHLVM